MNYTLREVILCMIIIIFFFVFCTAEWYEAPSEATMRFHWVEAQATDQKVEKWELVLQQTKLSQRLVWWNYNFCKEHSKEWLHNFYTEWRSLNKKVEELKTNQWPLKQRQLTARKKYNDCKEWKETCKAFVPKKTHSSAPSDIRWMVTYYANKIWVSQAKAHRVAECESNYKRCAKYPLHKSQDCSAYHRQIRNGSSASWVYQFTNATRDDFAGVYWYRWASKYNAEANIVVALSMIRDWYEKRRVCQ